jgi:alpha-glucosidase
MGRDGCRTPMQWNATPHAGFSTVAPWLPLSDDFAQESVVNLDADQRSILSLYKALIDLRKKSTPLVSGGYVPITAQGDLLIFRRQGDAEAVVIALNMGAEPVSIASETFRHGGEILLSSYLDRQGEKIQGVLDLRGNEGAIIGPGVQAG